MDKEEITFLLVGVIILVFLVDFILNSRKKSLEKSVEKFVSKYEAGKKEGFFNRLLKKLKPFTLFLIYPIIFSLFLDNGYRYPIYLYLDESESYSETITLKEYDELLSKVNKFETSICRYIFVQVFDKTTVIIFQNHTKKENYYKPLSQKKLILDSELIQHKIKEDVYSNEFSRFKNAEIEHYNLPLLLFIILISSIGAHLLLYILTFVISWNSFFNFFLERKKNILMPLFWILKRKKNISISLIIIPILKVLTHFTLYNDGRGGRYSRKGKNEFTHYIEAIFDERLELYIPITILFLLVIWFFNDKIKAK